MVSLPVHEVTNFRLNSKTEGQNFTCMKPPDQEDLRRRCTMGKFKSGNWERM